MLGLSDFASKGEQCDACVCEEGPSGRGSAEDLCSGTWAHLGGVFPLVLPYSDCLEKQFKRFFRGLVPSRFEGRGAYVTLLSK